MPYEILEALLTKCVSIFYVSVPTSISIMSLSALDYSQAPPCLVVKVWVAFTLCAPKQHSADRQTRDMKSFAKKRLTVAVIQA